MVMHLNMTRPESFCATTQEENTKDAPSTVPFGTVSLRKHSAKDLVRLSASGYLEVECVRGLNAISSAATFH